MYGLKSILALVAFLVGTFALVWGMVLTQVPWAPRNTAEAVAVLGTFFGFSLAALASSWTLMRKARREVIVDNPDRWRWTEYIVFAEASVCGHVFDMGGSDAP